MILYVNEWKYPIEYVMNSSRIADHSTSYQMAEVHGASA